MALQQATEKSHLADSSLRVGGNTMAWLKCCPRCNGDLYENQDMYGGYIACVQCGCYLSEGEEVVLKYSSPIQIGRETEKVPLRYLAAASARHVGKPTGRLSDSSEPADDS
jgi:hypothetical protein